MKKIENLSNCVINLDKIYSLINDEVGEDINILNESIPYIDEKDEIKLID